MITLPFMQKKLFELMKELVLVFDGNYLRHQKSKNNEYQRKSCSGQKKYSLVKPLTICTIDGFIVDVPGLFLAKENDASIMKKVMDDADRVRTIMREGDIYIVDTGFRDMISYLDANPVARQDQPKKWFSEAIVLNGKSPFL